MPVFLPVIANWSSQVSETYEFATSIFTSENGDEQRRSQIAIPRRTLRMGVLLDEHGGTAGMITVEDVLERIVGHLPTHTQDAVAAMERSTQGVVEGARLSDAAGSALADIDRVTRQLSDLIAQISEQASREAESANVVAANIQHIFAVTEQTGEGTRSTAQMVRELSRTAEDLKASVARFKVS